MSDEKSDTGALGSRPRLTPDLAKYRPVIVLHGPDSATAKLRAEDAPVILLAEPVYLVRDVEAALASVGDTPQPTLQDVALHLGWGNAITDAAIADFIVRRELMLRSVQKVLDTHLSHAPAAEEALMERITALIDENNKLRAASVGDTPPSQGETNGTRTNGADSATGHRGHESTTRGDSGATEGNEREPQRHLSDETLRAELIVLRVQFETMTQAREAAEAVTRHYQNEASSAYAQADLDRRRCGFLEKERDALRADLTRVTAQRDALQERLDSIDAAAIEASERME